MSEEEIDWEKEIQSIGDEYSFDTLYSLSLITDDIDSSKITEDMDEYDIARMLAGTYTHSKIDELYEEFQKITIKRENIKSLNDIINCSMSEFKTLYETISKSKIPDCVVSEDKDIMFGSGLFKMPYTLISDMVAMWNSLYLVVLSDWTISIRVLKEVESIGEKLSDLMSAYIEMAKVGFEIVEEIEMAKDVKQQLKFFEKTREINLRSYRRLVSLSESENIQELLKRAPEGVL